MQVLAVVVALCFALAVAQPPIPQTPTQFQANIKITTEGIFPTVTQGVYYYDFPNQRERIEVSQFGDTQVTVNLYNEMVSYTWDTLAGKCQCSALTDPMSPANVPYGSTYEGTGVVGTTQVNVWGLEDPIMKQVGMSINFYVSNQDYVVRINTTTSSPFGANTILMDLSNYVVGPPSNSEFVPASFCSCPPPPPPPGAGSCPGNPGQACQCATSSELSFCTAVNYPISNALDVQTTDQFVQAAYNTAIMVIPNPSANCQANFKAFLCAFYFGECVGTSNPITWLPCAGICPFCDCGTLAGNCTSAPSNLPCTQYGTSFCSKK